MARAPFSRAAEGARLPDGNPNLSATLALTQKHNLVANVNGDLDVVVFPNLATLAMTTRGSIVNGTPLSIAGTATTGDTQHLPTTSAQFSGVGFDVDTLAGQYNRYRIVGYGARLRVQAGVSATGEFLTAVMPLKGMVPPLSTAIPAVQQGFSASTVSTDSYWGGAGPRSTVVSYLDSMGLPHTGAGNNAVINGARLVNTPCHAVASAAQVAARGLHMRGLPFESGCRDYRTINFRALGTDSIDAATVVGAAIANAVQQYAVDLSYARIGGHESLVITGNGFTPNSTVASLEVVYHVEAITNPQYAVLARPTGQIARVASGQTLDQILTSVHRIPRISFSDVVQTVGDAVLGEVEGQIGVATSGAVSSLAGMLGRLMTAGA